jgi:hypothetical protein
MAQRNFEPGFGIALTTGIGEVQPKYRSADDRQF